MSDCRCSFSKFISVDYCHILPSCTFPMKLIMKSIAARIVKNALKITRLTNFELMFSKLYANHLYNIFKNIVWNYWFHLITPCKKVSHYSNREIVWFTCFVCVFQEVSFLKQLPIHSPDYDIMSTKCNH